jgi:hypothetical protein
MVWGRPSADTGGRRLSERPRAVPAVTLTDGSDNLAAPKRDSDLRFCDSRDIVSRRRQHMLMAQTSESFEEFLARVVRKLVPRLLVIDGELAAGDDAASSPAEDYIPDLLAELRMTVRLRNAVDDQIRFMVVACATSKAKSLLDQVLGAPSPRLTWKELGEALGVSAQAAHRKYGHEARAYEASRESDTAGERTGPTFCASSMAEPGHQG